MPVKRRRSQRRFSVERVRGVDPDRFFAAAVVEVQQISGDVSVTGNRRHHQPLLRCLTARDWRVVSRPIAMRQQETHAVHVSLRARVQKRALSTRVQLVYLGRRKTLN